jgi:hypothetical protein
MLSVSGDESSYGASSPERLCTAHVEHNVERNVPRDARSSVVAIRQRRGYDHVRYSRL